MLITDLPYLETLTQSSEVSGALQPDSGLITLSLSPDNTLSVKQGSTELYTTKLAGSPQGFSFSIPGSPNIAISSEIRATDGISTTTTILRFGPSIRVASFASAVRLALV
jgi:hypothetical protein